MEKNGLLLVDKPSGLTSHQVVGEIRRWLGQKSVGHAGTLDPLATGLLVLLVGKATKISNYILNGDKTYHARVKLGLKTDTDDITGEVLRQDSEYTLDEENLNPALEALTGEVELRVPVYSAVKQRGKKLYEKARQKEKVEAPLRKMNFYNVRRLGFGKDWVDVQLSCAKGGYIRSWARHLGESLGTGGVVEDLRRTESHPYNLTPATPLSALLERQPEELSGLESWIPMEKTLPEWPSVKIDGLDEKLISNGQIPRRLERYLEIQWGRSETQVPGIKVLSKRSGHLVALLDHEKPLNFRIRRVFPQQR